MATHYHANYVLPRWAPKLTKIEQIGAHIFYRWPGSWGKPRAFSDAYAGAEFIPAFSQLYQGGAANAEALPGDAIAAEGVPPPRDPTDHRRSEEHTSELQSLMRISYAVFCLKKKQRPRNYTIEYIYMKK